MSETMDIKAINVGQRLAVTDGDEVLVIDTFLDAEGDECGNSDNPAAFVVQLPNGQWFSGLVADYQPVSIQ